jgi:hypothetical protein
MEIVAKVKHFFARAAMTNRTAHFSIVLIRISEKLNNIITLKKIWMEMVMLFNVYNDKFSEVLRHCKKTR